MTVTAVFFDVGETIVDESRTWAELGRLCGIEPHVVWAGMGAVIERREHHRRVFELLGVEHPGENVLGWETTELYPDAAPCVARLRSEGIFVGLAGNVGTDIAPFVARHGLEVDFVATSHTLAAEKPARAFFERLVDAADRPAREIAYVGDRIDNDVVPAADAGLVALHLLRGPWGYLQARWPEASRAAARIRSLDELPGVLRAV